MNHVARWAALARSIPPAVMAEARNHATAKYYQLVLDHGHRSARRTLESGLADLAPPQRHEAEAVAPIVAAAQLLLSLK